MRVLTISFAVLVVAAVAAAGTTSASAQAGFDRPGGDYASAPVAGGDPSVCSARCERDRNCRSWSFSYPSSSGEPAMCWLKHDVVPRSKANCCVSGVRGAGVIEPALGDLEYSIDRIGGDYRSFETPLARPICIAGPGPTCGPATALPPRVAFSRTRSNRRTASRAVFRAWCAEPG